MTYDGIGRMETRKDCYTNQKRKRRTETSNAFGELVRTQDHLNGFVDYRYDEQGNLASSVQGGAGVTSVSTTIIHDLLGRKTSMTDADMGRWTYLYNAFGEVTRQTNALHQQTNMSYDRLGRMLRPIDADGTDAAWIYDTATKGLGQLHIEDIEQGAATPSRRTYGYDRFARPSDDLDRLTDVYQNGNRTLDMSYNALGNITTKRAYRATSGVDSNTDVGTYSYQSGTHRVTRVGTASYTYNANGSMLSGDGKSIAYSTLNKPTSVRRGSTTQHLYYGPNRSRYQRIDNINQSSEQVTHYVGGIERIWRSNGTVETKRYIGGEVLVTHTGATAQTHYLLRDHLGSVERIINSVGVIAQRMNFDAYGMRCSSTTSLSASARWTFNVALTTRGFTGHEGMDSVGLILRVIIMALRICFMRPLLIL